MKPDLRVVAQQPKELMRSLKALAWMTAGIGVAVFLVAQGIHVSYVMRGGATVLAQVVATDNDVREDMDGRRAGFVTVATYEFFAQGKRFGGSTEVAQGNLSVGDSIAIEYNPNDPGQNRAKGDRKKLTNYLLVLLSGGLFLYYAFTLNVPVIHSLFRSDTHTTTASHCGLNATFLIARCFAAALAIYAIGKHPYNFYVLTRWVVFLVCCWGFWLSRHRRWSSFALTYFVVGAVFNPLFPFHFQRTTWQVIDATVGIILLASLALHRSTHDSSNRNA